MWKGYNKKTVAWRRGKVACFYIYKRCPLELCGPRRGPDEWEVLIPSEEGKQYWGYRISRWPLQLLGEG